MEERNRAAERSVTSYIGSVVAVAMALYVVNMVPRWNLFFVTEDYPAVLWAMNLSLLVQGGGKLALVFYHPPLLHHLGSAVFDTFSLLALIILVTVFPFALPAPAGEWFTTAAKVLLVAAAAGTAFGILAHLARAVSNIVKYKDE
jgi:hypothetical protein